jgi:hypothetical protein
MIMIALLPILRNSPEVSTPSSIDRSISSNCPSDAVNIYTESNAVKPSC